MRWPDGPPPPLPGPFRGRPRFAAARCPDSCRACADACPTGAIAIEREPILDLGKCLFCTDCADACPEGAVTFERDHRLAASRREDLVVKPQEEQRLAGELRSELLRLFGRSLKLRQVSAGGCNACEADVNVLSTIGWDLSRFGIQFVASPRHADGILVTGCLSANMELALSKTYDAVPPPKLVIAVGACAISGGPFAASPRQRGGVAGFGPPVDLFVPGCPPHPLSILDGLLRLVGRLRDRSAAHGGAGGA
ncbi:MAG: hydrogenase [Planctomycetota bacterium]